MAGATVAEAIVRLESEAGSLLASLEKAKRDVQGWAEDTGSSAGQSLMGKLTGGVKGAVGGVVNAFGAIGLAKAGIDAVTGAIGNLVSGLVGGNAEFERYETQFSVLLKSTDAAKERLNQLAKFGAETPFDLPQLVRADKVLTAFGLHSADTAKRFGVSGEQILKTIGDVASGTGANFEEISVTFGKFASGATGEAIARFQELGIATKEEMASWGLQFSKSGQLLTPAREAFTVLEKHVRQKYGGMMDAQSKTFEGMVSNLQDWWGATKRQLGAPLFEVLKDKLGNVLKFLNGPEAQAAIAALANGIAEGVKVAVAALEWLGRVFSSVVEAIRPTVEFLGELIGNLFGAGGTDIGDFADAVREVTGIDLSGIVEPVRTFTAAIRQAVQGIGELLSGKTFEGIADLASGLAGIFGPETASAIVGGLLSIRDTIGNIIGAVGPLARAFGELFSSKGLSLATIVDVQAALTKLFGAPAAEGLLGTLLKIGGGLRTLFGLVKAFLGNGDLEALRGGLLKAFGIDIGPVLGVLRAFQELLGNIGATVGKVLEKLRGGDIGGAIGELLSGLGRQLELGVTKLLPAMLTLMGKLAQAAMQGLGKLGGLLIQALSKIDVGGVARSLGEKLSGIDWSGAIGKVAQAFGAVSGAIGEVLGQVDWSGIWQTAVGALSSAGSWVGGILGKIDWAGIWRVAVGALSQAGAWVGEVLGRVDWAGIWKTITGALSGAGAWVSEQLGRIDWAGIWKTITDALGQVGAWVGGILGSVDWAGIWKTVTGALSSAGAWVGEQLGKVDWAGIWKTITGALSQAGAWVGEQLGKVDWAGVWKTITGALSAAGSWVGEKLGAIDWGAVWKQITDALSAAGSWVGEQLGKIDWAAVWKTIVDAVGSIGAWLAEVIGKADLSAVGAKISEVLRGVTIPPISIGGITLLPSSVNLGDAAASLGPLLETFGKIGEALGSRIGPTIERVLGALAQAGSKISELFAPLMDLFSDLAPILGVVVGAFLGLANILLNAVAGALPGVVQFFVGFGKVVIGLIDLAITPLSTVIKALVALLSGDFAGAWEIVKSGVSGMWDALKTIFGGLADMILGPLNAVLGFVGGWVDGLYTTIFGGKLSDLVPGILAWFSSLPGKLGEILGSVLSAIEQPFIDVYNFLVGHSLIPDLVNGITGLFSGLIDGLGKIVGDIGAAIGAGFQAASDLVSGIATGLRDLVVGAFEGMRDLAGAAFEGLRDLAGAAFQALSDTVSSAAGTARDLAVGAFEALRDLAIGAFNALRDGVSAAAGAARDLAVGAFNALRDLASAAFNGLRDLAVGAFNGLRDGVAAAAGGARDLVSGAFNTLRDLASAAFNAARDTASAAMGALRDAVVGAANGAKDLVVGAFNSLRDLASGALGSLRDKASELFGGLRDKIVEMASAARDKAVESFSALRDKVVGAIEDLKKKAEGLVKDVVGFFESLPGKLSGLVQSITSAAGKMGSAIKDGLIAGVKGAVAGVGSLASGLLAALKAVINSGVDAINRAIPNSIGFEVAGQHIGIDLPDNPLPHLASGGRARAGLPYLWQEFGKEAFIPSQDGEVLPSSLMERLIGALEGGRAGGASLSISSPLIGQAVVQSQAQAEELVRRLEEMLRDRIYRAMATPPRMPHGYSHG